MKGNNRKKIYMIVAFIITLLSVIGIYVQSSKADSDIFTWIETSLSGTEYEETIYIPNTEVYQNKNLYLHIIATNNDGTVSGERVTGIYYIDPTYMFELDAVDSVTGIPVEESIFTVKGQKADGTVVDIADSLETDSEGKIYVQRAQLKDVTKLIIENTKAAAGYKKQSIKTIGIDTSTLRIEVNENEKSNDVNTSLIEEGKGIKVKVPVEKSTFDLKITNKELSSGSLISGTIFTLKQDGNIVATGTTEDGIVNLPATVAGKNKTVKYILTQSSLSDDYEAIGTITLNISFNDEGKVSKISQGLIGNSHVSIPNDKIPEIIVTNKRNDTSSFSLNIKAKDPSTGRGVEGNKYLVKIIQSGEINGESIETAVSDSNGNIKVDGLHGKGQLIIKFVQKLAPNGYVLVKEEESPWIIVNRDEDETISLVRISETGITSARDIDNTNHTININLLAKQKPKKMAIKVNLYSNQDESIGMSEIKLKLYEMLSGKLISTETTDNNGLAEFNDFYSGANGNGQIIYKLTSDDENFDKDILFAIEYKNGQIVNSEEMPVILNNPENTSIMYSEDDDDDAYKYTVNIYSGIDNPYIDGDNKLQITTTDSITGSPVQGVRYKILFGGRQISAGPSGVNGIISNMLPNASIKLKLIQTSVPAGYKVDSTEKTVTLTRTNDAFEITGLENILSRNIRIDENGDLIINEEVQPITTTTVKFKILAVDGEDTSTKLGGVLYNISTEGYSANVLSDSNNYVTMPGFEAKQGKTYEIEIRQLSTIEPYALQEEPIKIDFIMEYVNGKVKWKGTSEPIQGKKYVVRHPASYDESSNIVTAYFDLANFPKDENEIEGLGYGIDLREIDSENNEVYGAVYDIEVRPYAKKSINWNGTITNEIEKENLSISEDKTTILIRQKMQVTGYTADTKVKVVTVTIQDDKLAYMPDSTTDNLVIDIEKNNDGKWILKVGIPIEEYEAPEPTPTPTPGTDPTPGPGTDPTPGPGTDPTPTPGTNPTPGVNPTPTPGVNPTPTPVPTPEPPPDPDARPEDATVELQLYKQDRSGNGNTLTYDYGYKQDRYEHNYHGRDYCDNDNYYWDGYWLVRQGMPWGHSYCYVKQYQIWNTGNPGVKIGYRIPHGYDVVFYLEWFGHHQWIAHTTKSIQLTQTQKLLKIFGSYAEAMLTKGADVTLETRLVKNGTVSNEIYESSNSKANTNVNMKNGTDSIYLYKDYKGKTVEMTLHENVPPLNFKRNQTDAKYIVTFDENGNISSGYITQGIDTEEFAVGGLSLAGAVNNLGNLYIDGGYHDDGTRNTYTINGSIADYNSIGGSTIHAAMMDVKLNNPTTVNLKLYDMDTKTVPLTGSVNVSVYDEFENKLAQYENINVVNGIGSFKFKNTYANRTLKFLVTQTTSSKDASGYKFINRHNSTTQYEVSFNDDADIASINNIDVAENVALDFDKTILNCTIYNELDYNFAINITKLDENGNPLKDVRLKTIAKRVTNKDTGATTGNIFTSPGSDVTDKNGNVKLKITLPTTGANKIYNSIYEFTISEYETPDNYKATQDIKIIVTFDADGKIVNSQVKSVQQEEDSSIQITGKNNVSETDIEISSFDMSFRNVPITDKLTMKINNKDADTNLPIQGTKYRITSIRNLEYEKGLTTGNETIEPEETDSEGITNGEFTKGYALRTYIYKIQEIQTAEKYKTNSDILIKISYDKDGNIAETPQILNNRNTRTLAKGTIPMVSIVGNPKGSTGLELNILNELNPEFSLNITRYSDVTSMDAGRTYIVQSQLKNIDGSYSEVIDEERQSYESPTARTTIEFRNAHPNETMLYTIYEQTGEVLTQRGQVEVSFDGYGQVASVTKIDNSKYVTKATKSTEDKKAIDVEERTTAFHLNLTVKDKILDVTSSETSSSVVEGQNKAGYKFKVVSSKGEQNIRENVATNANGYVEAIIGEAYKDEVITYTISQLDSSVYYTDIDPITIVVTYDQNGNITNIVEKEIEDVYKVTSNMGVKNVSIDIYVEAIEDTDIKINVKDDKNASDIVEDYEYKITRKIDTGAVANYILYGTDGEGVAWVSTVKQNKGKTITYTLTQTKANEKYMMNGEPITIQVVYNSEGNVESWQLVTSDGYVTENDIQFAEDGDITINTKNKVKTIMGIKNISKQENNKNLEGSTFKIKEIGQKEQYYSSTKTTDENGEATLYVGPYYKTAEITYEIENLSFVTGYLKTPKANFSLTYDANGNILKATVPQEYQDFLSINLENKYNTGRDINITVQSQTAFTVGVNTIDSVTGTILDGGEFVIVQQDNNSKQDTVIAKDSSIEHATLGSTEVQRDVVYLIYEKEAPDGYEYINKGKIIGKIQVTYDENGEIVPGSKQIIDSAKLADETDRIQISENTDKLEKYDVDLTIKYDEIEEMKIIIEDESKTDSSKKISAIFTAKLENNAEVVSQTDSNGKMAEFMKLGIPAVNSIQYITIDQSDVPNEYEAINRIILKIETDNKSAIKNGSMASIESVGSATQNISFEIQEITRYSIKIKVFNNPKTVLNITNLEDGENQTPLNGKFEIYEKDGIGIEEASPLTIDIENGAGSIGIPSVPKNKTLTYILKQKKVDNGYKLETRDICLKVNYDTDGLITNAFVQQPNSSYVDTNTATVTSYENYSMDLKVYNRPQFELCLNVKDIFDNKDIQGVTVDVTEITYSNETQTLVTDSEGNAKEIISSTLADSTLTYSIKVHNNNYYKFIDKKDTTSYDVLVGTIEVKFDSFGKIDAVYSTNSNMVGSKDNDYSAKVDIKLTPVVGIDITRNDSISNEGLKNRIITISTSKLESAGSVTVTTDEDGKAGAKLGNIFFQVDPYDVIYNNEVIYTIQEEQVGGSTSNFSLTVKYDDKGYITEIIPSDASVMNVTGVGTRNIDLKITDYRKSTIQISAEDYFTNTKKLDAVFNIRSDKGESIVIGTKQSGTNIMNSGVKTFARIYPGETVTYTVEMQSVNKGYVNFAPQTFTVTFNKNGTIKSIVSGNNDILEVNIGRQEYTAVQANIEMNIRIKPSTNVYFKAQDSRFAYGTFNNGTNGVDIKDISFEVTDINAGQIYRIDALTDDDGLMSMQIPAYKDQVVTYKVKQIISKIGYKDMQEATIEVTYGSMGEIADARIVSGKNTSLDTWYSQTKWTSDNEAIIPIYVNLEANTKLGIESYNLEGEPVEGAEYDISITNLSVDETMLARGITDSNGQIVIDEGNLHKDRVFEYKISQVQSIDGCRRVGDIIFRVRFDSKGTVIGTPMLVQVPMNVTIEVGNTSKLVDMLDGTNKVDIKVKIQNTNDVAFKIVALDEKTGEPVKNASFKYQLDSSSGDQLPSTTKITNDNGEIQVGEIDSEGRLKLINANGKLKLKFQLMSVPTNKGYYLTGEEKEEYIIVNKNSDNTAYHLSYIESTLAATDYNINNEDGLVTVYVKLHKRMVVNLYDEDIENSAILSGGKHVITIQTGELTDDWTDIVNRTNNIIQVNEGNEIETTNGKISLNLGNPIEFANKTVVFGISTTKAPKKANGTNVDNIEVQYFVLQFGENGEIIGYAPTSTTPTTNRISMDEVNQNSVSINAFLKYGYYDDYSIKIIKESTAGEKIRINDTEFNVKISVNDEEKQNATLTTNDRINSLDGSIIESGVAVLNGLEYEGNLNIKIDETRPAEGYANINEAIDISLNLSLDKTNPDDIILNAENLIYDNMKATVEIDRNTKEIIITVKNSPIFGIQLNKTETKSGGNLIGINFNISVIRKDDPEAEKVDYGTFTTEDAEGNEGKIFANILTAYSDENILIEITEEEQSDYDEIPKIVLEAYVDSNGHIDQDSIQIVGGTEVSEILEKTSKNVSINVRNTLAEKAQPFAINVNKTDATNKEIPISDVIFNIKITPEEGIALWKVIRTDNEGKINIPNLYGRGNIKIELREVIAPDKYKLSSNQGLYSYDISIDDEGNISLVNGEGITIDNDNKIVDLDIENESSDELPITIAINKIDSETGAALGKVRFEIENTETNEKTIITTNRNGVANYKFKTEGNFDTFKIKELDEIYGYVKDSTNRTIRLNYIGGEIDSETHDEGLILKNKRNNYIEYTIENSIDETLPKYQIQLVNIAKENNSIKLPEAKFEFNIQSQLGPDIFAGDKTDENGLITISKLNSAGNITLNISNRLASAGYRLIVNPMVINLNKDRYTEEITLENETLPDNVKDLVIDNENHIVTIFIESEKMTNKFNLILNPIDVKTGENIKGSEIIFNVNINGTDIGNYQTNEEGKIRLNNLDIPDVQIFDITLKEIETPDGYSSIDDEQKIRINVAKVYGERKLGSLRLIGQDIQLVNSSTNECEVNILYGNEIPLYLKSREYLIGEKPEGYIKGTTETEYKNEDLYISKVNSKTKLEDYLNNIDTNGTVVVTRPDGTILGLNEYVGTGMKLTVKKGKVAIELLIAVTGDVDGNGKVELPDLVEVRKKVAKLSSTINSEIRMLAVDFDDNGKVELPDLCEERKLEVKEHSY